MGSGKKDTAVIVLCGGNSSRFGHDKQFELVGGVPVYIRSVMAFASCGSVSRILIAAPDDRLYEFHETLVKYKLENVMITAGGETRQKSVWNASLILQECEDDFEYIAVHDGARPLVKTTDIERTIQAAREYGAAVLGVMETNSLKRLKDGFVDVTVQRDEIFAAQTPQIFAKHLFKKALCETSYNSFATDDSQIVEKYINVNNLDYKIAAVVGSYENIKITHPSDIYVANAIIPPIFREEKCPYRIGQGYDVHRLEAGRKLVLGGVEIPHERGLLGHSDADVLLHALMDSLLGAACLGDIGRHFPDTDENCKGVSSMLMLEKVVCLLKKNKFEIVSADCTVIAQEPKLVPYIPQMTKNISKVLKTNAVSVKATTEEGLGFTGEKLGVAAQAVSLLYFV